VGEVVVENGDIFGDGVNIASRIQSLANPGSIFVSEPVHGNLSNKKNVRTRFVREEVLKNVKLPVRMYEVLAENESRSAKIDLSNKSISEKSIAVLPFVDMSAAKDQEFMADGLAEELINRCSQLKDLKVIGRTSSFSFKGTKTNLKEIGRILGVKTILEGSIQKSGNRLRITVQLVNANDEFHIWSQRYDRELDDIFAVQDDICSKVAQHLKSTFFADRRVREEKRPTSNMEAYEMVLHGKFFLDKRVEGFVKAKEYFIKAIELDPFYAEAYFHLGMTYLTMGMYMLVSNKKGMRLARECASNALKIDPKYPEGHILMAYVHVCEDLDWKAADREYNEALRYAGSDFFPDDFHKFSCWLRFFIHDDFDYAINKAESYLENDPLSAQSFLLLGQIYFYSDQYDRSRNTLKRLLELYPGHSEAHRYIGFSYCQEKDFKNAINHFRKAVEISQGQGWSIVFLVWGLGQAGEKKEALGLVEQIKASSRQDLMPSLAWMVIYSAIGEIDLAFKYFEEAFNNREFWLFTMKYGHEWDLLRPDPRFNKIMERMNFPK
jgi:TolB-like protein/Tfp pilus assembly protein PilF